jgi:hypothetical protein
VSRLVTGVGDLPAALAPVYLGKLEALDLRMRPSELAGVGKSASSLDDLERAAFNVQGGRQCAEQIAAAWWSGFVPVPGGGFEVVT